MGAHRFGRRTLIFGGVAAAALAGVAAGEYTEVLPGGVTLRRMLGLTGPDGSIPDVPAAVVATRQFPSQARGRLVTVVAMSPIDTDPAGLPVCLVLHGRGNDAQGMIALGLPQFLTAAVRGGMPPIAVVAVDGGDSYWVANTPTDDPQAMLTAELPGWLATLGLRGQPSAVLGISMGCFGALVYARCRASAPLRAAALLSPALFRDWTDAAAVHAFSGEQQWSNAEPLRHLDKLPGATALGIWCGVEDPFFPAATDLAAKTHPAVAVFPHGQHNDGFWRRVLPDALAFLGGR